MTVKNLGWSFIFRMFFCHKTRLLFQYWQLELCVPVHTCTQYTLCLQFQGGYPIFPDKVFMWFVMEMSPFPRLKGSIFIHFCDINLRLVIISVDCLYDLRFLHRSVDQCHSTTQMLQRCYEQSSRSLSHSRLVCLSELSPLVKLS